MVSISKSKEICVCFCFSYTHSNPQEISFCFGNFGVRRKDSRKVSTERSEFWIVVSPKSLLAPLCLLWGWDRYPHSIPFSHTPAQCHLLLLLPGGEPESTGEAGLCDLHGWKHSDGHTCPQGGEGLDCCGDGFQDERHRWVSSTGLAENTAGGGAEDELHREHLIGLCPSRYCPLEEEVSNRKEVGQYR